MGKYRNIFFSEAIALIEPMILNGLAQKLLNLKKKQKNKQSLKIDSGTQKNLVC
jgi:hypothetical protein